MKVRIIPVSGSDLDYHVVEWNCPCCGRIQELGPFGIRATADGWALKIEQDEARHRCAECGEDRAEPMVRTHTGERTLRIAAEERVRAQDMDIASLEAKLRAFREASLMLPPDGLISTIEPFHVEQMILKTRHHLDALCAAVLEGQSFDDIDLLVGMAINDGSAAPGDELRKEQDLRRQEGSVWPSVEDLASAIDFDEATCGAQEYDCGTCGNAGSCEREESCTGWFPRDGEEGDPDAAQGDEETP